jgi:hypothetical protein
MVIEQMIDIALRAGEEIVDAYDIPTIREQSLTEMRAEKASPPGDQYARFKVHVPAIPLNYGTMIGLSDPSLRYVPYRKAIFHLENQGATKKAC